MGRPSIPVDVSIVRRAWAIAWPLIVGEMIDSVLWVTDTFFVSGLGDEAIAAVGAGGYASWLFFVVNNLFFTGVMVLVAQAYGAGRLEEAGLVVGETLTAALLFSGPLLVGGYYASGWLLALILGATGTGVYALSLGYLLVRLLGLPAAAAMMVFNASFRGVGYTKPILVAMASASAFNIVMDPLLIYGLLGFPALGVKGAAAASSLALLVDASIEGFFARRILPFPVRPRLPRGRALLSIRVGLPALVERIAFTAGNLAYFGSVARCGEDALAAHTIGVRIESFAYMPAFAMATAASTLTGQEVGRGDIEAGFRAGWEVAKTALIFMIVVGGLLVAISPYAPLVFTRTRRIAFLSMIYLVLAGVSEPALGMVMSLASSIRGAGNTLIPSIANLAGLYMFRVVPAYLLPRFMPPGLCVLGAWIAMDLDLFLRTIVFTILYKGFFYRLARRLV